MSTGKNGKWECRVCYCIKDMDDQVKCSFHDDPLCDLCRMIDLDYFFRHRSAGRSDVFRSFSHIASHEKDCDLCGLTWEALKAAGVWEQPQEMWVMLSAKSDEDDRVQNHHSWRDEGVEAVLASLLHEIPSNYIVITIYDGPSGEEYKTLKTPYTIRLQLSADRCQNPDGSFTKNSLLWRHPKLVQQIKTLPAECMAVFTRLPLTIFCARQLYGQTPFELLKRRMRQCEETHPSTCRSANLKEAAVSDFTFRLIDVQKAQVVDATPEPRFFCLSYTWGRIRQTVLTESTRSILCSPGGLHHPALKVGRTILDALILCRELGEAYLWVDAFCIMQDDPGDMAAHIANMGAIYSAAAVTIIAAAGVDADAGLPGLQPRSRKYTQWKGMAHGYELRTSLPPVFEVLQQSAWNKRAWTFQEAMLSRRMLGFTAYPHQTFFECKVHRLPEDTTREADLAQPIALFNDRSLPWRAFDRDLSWFIHHLADFSSRQLSYQSDVLNAFSAIMASFWGTLEGAPNAWYFGMPTAAFGFALCFKSSVATAPRRQGFPSWSWAGWQARVHMGIIGPAASGLHKSYDPHDAIVRTAQPTIMMQPIAHNDALRSKWGRDLLPRMEAKAPLDLNSPILCFTTSMTTMCVAREPYRHDERGTPYYLVTNRHGEMPVQCEVDLDPAWRARQEEDMCDFIVVHSLKPLLSEFYVLYCMLVEKSAEHMEEGEDVYRRVQIGPTMEDWIWMETKPREVSIKLG